MDRPNMLTDARFHRRSDAQGLVNPHEVVVHMEQRDHGNVIIELLAKGIRQAREASHVHPHVQVLALDLNTLGGNVADNAVLVLGAGGPDANPAGEELRPSIRPSSEMQSERSTLRPRPK